MCADTLNQLSGNVTRWNIWSHLLWLVLQYWVYNKLILRNGNFVVLCPRKKVQHLLYSYFVWIRIKILHIINYVGFCHDFRLSNYNNKFDFEELHANYKFCFGENSHWSWWCFWMVLGAFFLVELDNFQIHLSYSIKKGFCTTVSFNFLVLEFSAKTSYTFHLELWSLVHLRWESIKYIFEDGHISFFIAPKSTYECIWKEMSQRINFRQYSLIKILWYFENIYKKMLCWSQKAKNSLWLINNLPFGKKKMLKCAQNHRRQNPRVEFVIFSFWFITFGFWPKGDKNLYHLHRNIVCWLPLKACTIIIQLPSSRQ